MGFTTLVVMIAEGFGSIPVVMAHRAYTEWNAAGRPADWLFICTGDKIVAKGSKVTILMADGSHAEISQCEATISYEKLLKFGVPENQLLVENRSGNTYGQTLEVRRELVNGVTTPSSLPSVIDVILCTHKLHYPRTYDLFVKNGYTIANKILVPYKRELKMQDRNQWHMCLPSIGYMAMEMVALLRDKAKKWL
jgi:hypothetical protein